MSDDCRGGSIRCERGDGFVAYTTCPDCGGVGCIYCPDCGDVHTAPTCGFVERDA